MPIYNLRDYISNYSNKTGSSWFYSKNEADEFSANFANNNNFKFFKCKSKLLQNTKADGVN